VTAIAMDLTNSDSVGLPRGLFAFNYSALATLGVSAAAISGIGTAIGRLVDGVTSQLFTDNRQCVLRDYFAYAQEEFYGRWPR
jgi:hypothetical protein